MFDHSSDVGSNCYHFQRKPVVHLIRKAELPEPADIAEPLRDAAVQASHARLREPRPTGFPLIFTSDMTLMEAAIAYLHEHGVQRARTPDTLRTYSELLCDWFEALEQNNIVWTDADATHLVAYRNRMMRENSAHTKRPYQVSTINHRVRGILRFYEWAVRKKWLSSSPLAALPADFAVARRSEVLSAASRSRSDSSIFVLRQFESMPRPLNSEQARDLLASLMPPYDLMARWQLYTGLRVSELLRLSEKTIVELGSVAASQVRIDVVRKGRKPGYVIAPESLIHETRTHIESYRRAWLLRAVRRRKDSSIDALFLNSRGAPVGKNAYQRAVSQAGKACGFHATTHLLRATFACMLLARLERVASEGAAINPLLIVKILMGHERIETTDRYLRAVSATVEPLKEILGTLLIDAV